MKVFQVSILLIALALSGCVGFGADSYEPYQDAKGVDQTNYRTDLVECRVLAKNAPHLFDAVGTAAGGVSGALGGATTGSPQAIAGGAAAAAAAKAVVNLNVLGINERHVVDQCMRYRGYHILGDE